MSTSLMIDSYDHDFQLQAESEAAVLKLIAADRSAGRLRSQAASGVSDQLALDRFALACAVLKQAEPKLRGAGSARRGVAHARLKELLKDFRDLREAVRRVQAGIGSDTYDELPPGALSALQGAARGGEPLYTRRITSFADFLPDPLRWQNRMAEIAVTEAWVDEIEPVLVAALASFAQPGRSSGSARRLAAIELVNLLRLLDRGDGEPVRKPSRKHVMAWLELLSEVSKETLARDLESLAKRALNDVFHAGPADWTHPNLPHTEPRNVLTCSVSDDGVQHWSGALAERCGQS